MTAVLLLASACGARGPAQESLVPRHVHGVRVAPLQDAGLPYEAWGSDQVELRGPAEGPVARVFAYERSEEREAYGVYGVGGQKASMTVAWPLDPDTIAWDDVPPRQALERLLERVGAPAPAAFVEAEASWLWAEGARVLVLVPSAPEEAPEKGLGPMLLHAELADRGR